LEPAVELYVPGAQDKQGERPFPFIEKVPAVQVVPDVGSAVGSVVGVGGVLLVQTVAPAALDVPEAHGKQAAESA